jgi:hypothetical protein
MGVGKAEVVGLGLTGRHGQGAQQLQYRRSQCRRRGSHRHLGESEALPAWCLPRAPHLSLFANLGSAPSKLSTPLPPAPAPRHWPLHARKRQAGRRSRWLGRDAAPDGLHGPGSYGVVPDLLIRRRVRDGTGAANPFSRAEAKRKGEPLLDLADRISGRLESAARLFPELAASQRPRSRSQGRKDHPGLRLPLHLKRRRNYMHRCRGRGQGPRLSE